MGAGARVWEKTHPKQVLKERELSRPYPDPNMHDKVQNASDEMTKKASPAGEDRKIEKEDKSGRRKFIDKQIEDAGG